MGLKCGEKKKSVMRVTEKHHEYTCMKDFSIHIPYSYDRHFFFHTSYLQHMIVNKELLMIYSFSVLQALTLKDASTFNNSCSVFTLTCLSIGTPKTINFPFVSNEKLMVYRCPNIQAHYNEAVIYLNFGTPKNNEFSIWNKWKIYYFKVSQYLSTLGYVNTCNGIR